MKRVQSRGKAKARVGRGKKMTGRGWNPFRSTTPAEIEAQKQKKVRKLARALAQEYQEYLYVLDNEFTDKDTASNRKGKAQIRKDMKKTSDVYFTLTGKQIPHYRPH